MKDSQHTIFTSAKRFFSGTILSRLSGLLRDIVMASAFGTHEAVAAFMAAFRFAHLFRRIFGEGSLQTAFIPQFEELRSEKPKAAYLFFRDLSILLSLILCVIIGFSFLGLNAVISFGNLSPDSIEVTWLTILMMPSLLFICLYGLNTGFLQCERHYFIGSVAPVAFNIIWVLATLYLWNLPASQAMQWLSFAVIIGCLAQWLMTMPSTLSAIKANSELSLWKEKMDIAPLRKLALRFFLSLVGVGATQVNTALDSLFARYAENAGPAYLWYAIRIEQLPLALFGIALSGALLPPLSRAIKAYDIQRFKIFLDFAVRRTIGFLLPTTLAILILGCASINFLYGRGLFDRESVVGTTWCLWGYGIGLLPSTLILIIAPAYYAQGNYKIPAIASISSVIINIFLNTIMVAFLGLGAASIAFATSLSAIFNFLFLIIPLTLKFGPLITPTFKNQVMRSIAASLMGAFACVVSEYYLFGQITSWQILLNLPFELPKNFFEQLLILVVPTSIFGIFLFLTAWLCQAEDIGIKIKSQELEVRG